MREVVISSRYARALFNVAVEDKKEEVYLEDLKKLDSFFDENKDIFTYVILPIFPKKRKKEVIDTIKESMGLSQAVNSFLDVLFENNRVNLLKDIIQEYQKLLDQKMGIKRGTIYSPFPLDKKTVDKISKSISNYLGAKRVILNTKEDKDILGGIKLKVGDLVIDGSLKAQLKRLKEKLLEG